MSAVSVAPVPTRPAAARASLKRGRRWALFASYFFLILFAIFFLTPPYYMIITSLKTDAEMAHMATNPWFIFNGVTLDQYKLLLFGTDFLIFFKNTVIVTVCVVAITMVVSVLAVLVGACSVEVPPTAADPNGSAGTAGSSGSPGMTPTAIKSAARNA